MEKIEGLDSIIEPIVNLLRENGVETTYSCQGGEGHLSDYPEIHVEARGIWLAVELCKSHSLPLLSVRQVWLFGNDDDEGWWSSDSSWEMEFYGLD